MNDRVAFRRNGAVLFRFVHDAVLLLDPADGEVLALGGAGPDLWGLLAEPHTMTDALESLADSYSVRPGRIEAEVREVFTELARRTVLVAATP